MHITNILLSAFFILTTHACNPNTNGCDHPGNFTGNLTLFTNPAAAYCNPGNETFIYASIPATFYNPPDESPCDSPINVTNPSTAKTVEAIVIGECTSCAGDDIELTTAGMDALSPNGKTNMAPATVKWTFIG